jgi:hypothetical protein
MTLENGGYHVDPCGSAVSARRRASGLHFASTNLSAAPDLLLRPRCLQADRCSLHCGRWCGCDLPSDTASISYAGLKQLGNRSLIILEQFIRPLQPFQSLGQRLDLLIMRLDFLLDRGDLVAQPLVERIDGIHLAIFLKDRRPVAIVLERSGSAPY